ncbi:Uncharacterised protein [Legionella busanensis]|uniref:Uncharacterized protein n=1 Tax=Legionella busanensis TaxID=190655 RepID=A0A378K9F4_9GAMM|nr:hypothetical protein [Legionella busanensis]STX81578.1 Uncharacterised protein [Legionella busanensis]
MNWKKIFKGCLRIVLVALTTSLEISCTKNRKSIYNANQAYDLFEKGEIGYQEFARATKRYDN